MAIPPARDNQHNQDTINGPLGTCSSDVRPTVKVTSFNNIRGLFEFAASTDSVSKGFTNHHFQLLDSDVEMEVDHIASSWVHVYASQDMLISQSLLMIGGGSGRTLF